MHSVHIYHNNPCMGMHADCGHGIIMATSMAQLHMQAMTLPLWLILAGALTLTRAAVVVVAAVAVVATIAQAMTTRLS